MNDDKQWVCTVCGYVYDGDIPFEELPEDWACPVCGVGKEFSDVGVFHGMLLQSWEFTNDYRLL